MSQSGRTDGAPKLLMVIKGPTLPGGKKQLKMGMDMTFGSTIKNLKQRGKLLYDDGSQIVDPKVTPSTLGFEAGKMVQFTFEADEMVVVADNTANNATTPTASAGGSPSASTERLPPSVLMPKPAAANSIGSRGGGFPTEEHPGGVPPNIGVDGTRSTSQTQSRMLSATATPIAQQLQQPEKRSNSEVVLDDGLPVPPQAKPLLPPPPVSVPHPHRHRSATGNSPSARQPVPRGPPLNHTIKAPPLQTAAGSESVASNSMERRSQQGSVAVPTPREREEEPSSSQQQQQQQPARFSVPVQHSPLRTPRRESPVAQPSGHPPSGAPSVPARRRESPTARFHQSHSVDDVRMMQPQPAANTPHTPSMVDSNTHHHNALVGGGGGATPTTTTAKADASPPRSVPNLSQFSLGPGRPTSHGPPRRTVTATNVAAPPQLNPWPNESPLDMYGSAHGLGPSIHPSHPELQRSQAGDDVSSRHSIHLATNTSLGMISASGQLYDQSNSGPSPVRPRPLSTPPTPSPYYLKGPGGGNNTSPPRHHVSVKRPNQLPPQAPPVMPVVPPPVENYSRGPSLYQPTHTMNREEYHHRQQQQQHNSFINQSDLHTAEEVDALKDEITLLRAELELEKAHREQLASVVKQLAQNMHDQGGDPSTFGQQQDQASREHVKLMEQLRAQRQASRASRSNSMSPQH